MHIGLLLTTVKAMGCMHVMEFYLIMSLPRRGETFVTRKITRGLTRIALGLETCLYMGNIDALEIGGMLKIMFVCNG
jgi:hypothetical protein